MSHLWDDGNCLPSLATPDTQGPINTLGCQESPIHRECDGIHKLGVPFERGELFAAGRVPQLNRSVIAPTGQHYAYRVERNTSDKALVPCKGAEQFATASHLPQLHCTVEASTGQYPARMVEGYAQDFA